MILFGRMFLDGLMQRGLYPLDEAGLYLVHELVLPLGLLTAGFLLGLFSLRRRVVDPEIPGSPGNTLRVFTKRALIATIPALLILPQGGVLERGGYFMTMAPLFAVLFAMAIHAVWSGVRSPAARGLTLASCAVLVAVQASLALDARADFRAAAPDARAWAKQVATQLQPGDKIFVSDLARNLALTMATEGVYVRDLKRDLDLVPGRIRTETLKSRLAERLQDPNFPGDLYLDADLLPGLQAADLAETETTWPEDWRNTLLRLAKISPTIPLTLVPTLERTSLLKIQLRSD